MTCLIAWSTPDLSMRAGGREAEPKSQRLRHTGFGLSRVKGRVEKSREGTQQDGVSVKSGLDLTYALCVGVPRVCSGSE